jgi:hypothetical protein
MSGFVRWRWWKLTAWSVADVAAATIVDLSGGAGQKLAWCVSWRPLILTLLRYAR